MGGWDAKSRAAGMSSGCDVIRRSCDRMEWQPAEPRTGRDNPTYSFIAWAPLPGVEPHLRILAMVLNIISPPSPAITDSCTM